MKKYTLMLSVLFTTILFIGCGNTDGKMPRQVGNASSEAAAGLDALHHLMFDVARAEFDKGIDKDPNCVTCYLNKAHAEQDIVLKRELFETALELSKRGHPETVLAQAAVDWINATEDVALADQFAVSRFAGYSDLYKKYPNDRFLAAGSFKSLVSLVLEDGVYDSGSYSSDSKKLKEARAMLLETAERLNVGYLYNLLAYNYMTFAEPRSIEYNMALPYIEKYIELDPKQANALNSLAEFYLNMEDYDLAVRYYTEATQLDTNFLLSQRNLAVIQYEAKLSMGNGKIMSLSTEERTEYFNCTYSQNDLYLTMLLAMNNPSQADSDALLKKYGTKRCNSRVVNASDAFNEGRWQLYNLEWENAHKSFSNAIEQDANFALAYAMRARTSAFLGNADDLKDDLDIAVSMSLNATEDEASLINALAASVADGTNDVFNKTVEELSDKYPDDSMLAFETVFATLSDRGADVVLARAKALYAMNPNFTPALNMIGYAYMDKGDLDNAGKMLQKQVRRAPASANPYDSMGDYYLAIEDNVSALKYFEQSAKMGLKASIAKADSLKNELKKEE